ncbi:hypothetical protein OH492_27405 [Vibrio chagasii]|nr:hypothetical protein [Vibrio chagasii]
MAYSACFIASITAKEVSKPTLKQHLLRIEGGINDSANVAGASVATTSSLLLTCFGIRHENYIDMPRPLAGVEEARGDAIVAVMMWCSNI